MVGYYCRQEFMHIHVHAPVDMTITAAAGQQTISAHPRYKGGVLDTYCTVYKLSTHITTRNLLLVTKYETNKVFDI
jgi:hypothetical protein